MTDSAYDVILKNRLLLLPEAIVCEKTLHAHAVSCIAGGPWPALPWPWLARGCQYSTELTMAMGSSNVASLICFGVGMESISPVGE